MNEDRFLFSKKYKLKSHKLIHSVFHQGKSITVYPLKVLYLYQDRLDCNQVGISVPKRNFKKAVDRNRIKRIIREAYRLNQNKLKSYKKYAMMFLYLDKKEYSYTKLEDTIKRILGELNML